MRRSLLLMVCCSLSLSSLGAWAGPAGGRPRLAPIAWEACCPLADGTWDLGATLSSLSACPAEACPAEACPAEACPAEECPAEECPAEDLAGQLATDRSGAAAAEPPSATRGGREGEGENVSRKVSPGPIVVRRGGWEEEYLPYDLMPADRFRLQLFPLELPRLNYLPLAPVAGLEPQRPVAADPAAAGSVEARKSAPTTEGETPSASLASSEESSSPAPAELAASDDPVWLANADCILDDWLWRAGRYLERPGFSWRRAARQGGRRLAAGLSPATDMATRALAALPPAVAPARALAQQEADSILLASPRGAGVDAEPTVLAAESPAPVEADPVEAVRVGPPAPARLARPRQTAASASSMLATAESLKAAGALLRQLGEGLERLATRQAQVEAAARRF